MNIIFINYNVIKGYARVMYNDVKDADKYKIEVAYNGKDVKDLLEYLFKLESKIDKANELLEEILVVSDWEHEGRFRPVKGTTAQDVYKTIIKLNELLETPRRTNYELLKEDK